MPVLNQDSINYRLSELIEILGLTKNQFANKIGVSSALISKITTKEINFGVEIIEKIVYAFPEINVIWLLNGSGQMMVSNSDIYKGGDIENFSNEFFIDFKINHLKPLEEELIDLITLSNLLNLKGIDGPRQRDIVEVFKPFYRRIENLISNETEEADQKLVAMLYSDLHSHVKKYQARRRELFQDLRFRITDGIVRKTIVIQK